MSLEKPGDTMTSDGFYQMSFTTAAFGQHAIDALTAFAPIPVHAGLQAQISHLVQIHDTGMMPKVGVTGLYTWWLGVWSRPTMRMTLLVGRSDGRVLSIAEGLRIEREAIARADSSWLQAVKIEPYDFGVNSRLRRLVSQNTNAGRHWSHGLMT